MPALEALSMFGAQLSTAAIESLAGAPCLTNVTLRDNGLKEADLAPLAGHRSLQKLNLQGLPINRRGSTILGKIPGLTWLMISGTSWWARRILKKAFPRAELEFS